MLKTSLVLFILAIVAGIFGFTDILSAYWAHKVAGLCVGLVLLFMLTLGLGALDQKPGKYKWTAKK